MGPRRSSAGSVLSLERLNRILEIDAANLLAVVEPNVINAALQAAVEPLGLSYPPDPASLNQSSLGGNVAECAGGPRAFKYGTPNASCLGTEAVLPTGAIILYGGRTVKNVVGYDLTSLLVGLEGDARDHHAGDSAADSAAGGLGHASGDVFEHRPGGERGQRHCGARNRTGGASS